MQKTFFEYLLTSPIDISGRQVTKIIVNAPNREIRESFEIHCRLRHILTQSAREQHESNPNREKAEKQLTDKEISDIENKTDVSKAEEVFTSKDLQVLVNSMIYRAKDIDIKLVYELIDTYLRKMGKTDSGLRLDNIILNSISINDLDGLLGGYIKYFFIDLL